MEEIKRKEMFGHPVGLFVLFFTEMWERFSYYGMRAILVLYMTSATMDGPLGGLGWSQASAIELYGWYTMLVYVMSIPGGIIADKLVGQKKMVLIGGIILVIGHSILAIEADWAFFTGLVLIILGVGGLKPNISTMVGGLYPPGDKRRDSGFTLFYIGINVGALLSGIIVGTLGETMGWHYGFGLAGIGMVAAQIVYMWGQKHLIGVGESPSNKTKSLDSQGEDTSIGKLFANLLKSPLQLVITLVLLGAGIGAGFYFFEGINKWAYIGLFSFLSICAGLLMMIYKDINKVEKDRFLVLLITFLIVIVFWGAFEQAGGFMNLYTRAKIDRAVPLLVLDILFFGGGAALLLKGILSFVKKNKEQGMLFLVLGIVVAAIYGVLRFLALKENPYTLPTSIFQSVNPFFIIVFGTVVGGFWVWWSNKKLESSSIFKIAIGTIIMGTGFIFMGIASKQTGNPGDKGMLILLILAYLLHTVGELSSSPVALSFITKIAPVKYVSIMMGFYFAATGLGNKLAGTIGESAQPEPAKIELTASASTVESALLSQGVIADTTLSKGMPFSLTSGLDKSGDTYVMDYNGVDVRNWFEFGEEGKEQFDKEWGKVDDDELHAVLNLSLSEDAESTPENPTGYNGTVTIYEVQNKREFWTFMSIFGFTAAFGLLLILLLKPLKRMTHGAEEGEDDTTSDNNS